MRRSVGVGEHSSDEQLVRATVFTEAGPDIGYGHLTRCVALTDALEATRAGVRLIVRGQAPGHLVEERSVELIDWTDVGVLDQIAADSDIVVVDSYRAGIELYDRLASTVPVCVWLDDLDRLQYPAGIIVNGAPHAPRIDYGDREEGTLLLGCEYAIVRRPFWDAGRRHVADEPDNVLVVFGGSDVRAMAQRVASGIAESALGLEVDVVRDHRSATKMKNAMLRADVAVTAAGQTLYELAATGTPAIAVSVAENQEQQARSFSEAGAIDYVGSWEGPDIVDAATTALERLAPRDARQQMSEAAQSLVDGRGALRVARRAVGRALAARIEVRRATPADEQALLAVANDPVVRAASFDTNRITAHGHHEWYQARLADPDTLLMLAWDSAMLAGYVRFEVAGDEAEVSTALAQPYRGTGYAPYLLEAGLDELGEGYPQVRDVVAAVRADNQASARFFEAAGFARCSAASGDRETLVKATEGSATA